MATIPGGPPAGSPDGASNARMWAWLYGGRNYRAADEAAGQALIAACPTAPRMAANSRLFSTRAVGYAGGERGIRQVIDLACGAPPSGLTHDVARTVRRGTAVAYVDLDREVLDLLDARAGGAAGIALVRQDAYRPDKVLADPALGKVIDLGEPVLLLAAMAFQWLPPRRARRVVGGYARRLAPGSLIAVSVPHVPDPAVMAAVRAAYAPMVPHSYDAGDVAGLLAGLELVPPGVAPAKWLQPGWEDVCRRPPDGPHVLAGIGGVA